eukprot:jgi/Botrbrau1/7473/Bobra.0095s0011.1
MYSSTDLDGSDAQSDLSAFPCTSLTVQKEKDGSHATSTFRGRSADSNCSEETKYVSKKKRRHLLAKIKTAWLPEEDEKLASLVDRHGQRVWSYIAQHFPGRIGKQCRERWNNQLRPGIRRDAWTPEEEEQLVVAHQKMGNCWAEIAKHIAGRSENSVKNHWNATCRRSDTVSGKSNTSPLKEYIRSLGIAGRKKHCGKRGRSTAASPASARSTPCKSSTPPRSKRARSQSFEEQTIGRSSSLDSSATTLRKSRSRSFQSTQCLDHLACHEVLGDEGETAAVPSHEGGLPTAGGVGPPARAARLDDVQQPHLLAGQPGPLQLRLRDAFRLVPPPLVHGGW